MKLFVHSLCGIRTWLTLLAIAEFTIPAGAATINVQSSQLEVRGNLTYESTFGSGSSGSYGRSGYGPIEREKVRGNGGAGAVYSYALDWNGPFNVGDQLETFKPMTSPTSAVGFAVDPGGSSFFSRSEICNHGDAWSLLIEPSEGETMGTPVLIQIDTHISGDLSACGIDAIAEAQFFTTSDGGSLLDESLSVVNDELYFDFSRSQTFERAIGEEFTLQFDHVLEVSGEYGTAASAAYADIWDFSLTATVTPIPEPSSLTMIVFAAAGLLARRAFVCR